MNLQEKWEKYYKTTPTPAPKPAPAPAPEPGDWGAFYAQGGMPTITTPTIAPPPTPSVVEATGGYIPPLPAQTVLATSGYGQPTTAPTLANYIQQNLARERLRSSLQLGQTGLSPLTHEERMLAAKQEQQPLGRQLAPGLLGLGFTQPPSPWGLPSIAGTREIRSITREPEGAVAAPGPMSTEAIRAWAARYTGEAMFDYKQRPNYITTALAEELPYKSEYGGGYDTVEEFLTEWGYEELSPGQWYVKDPVPPDYYPTGGYGGYGYYPYYAGGYGGGGGGGGQGGGLIMWRIGL